jgi:hypothetical protein
VGATIGVTVAAQFLAQVAAARPDLSFDGAVLMLRDTYLPTATPLDCEVLAAGALSGAAHYVDAVASVLAALAMRDDDDNDDLMDDAKPRYDCAAARLVYRVCVEHGCALGTAVAAPFLTIDHLIEPVVRAIWTLDDIAAVERIKRVRRAAALRWHKTKDANGPYAEIDQALWTALLEHNGTPAMALALFDIAPQRWLSLKSRRASGLLRVRPVRGGPTFDIVCIWRGGPEAEHDAVRLVKRAAHAGDCLIVAWMVGCHQEYLYNPRSGVDPPFGPVLFDDIVRLSMRAGTYSEISPWLIQQTDARPTAETIARVLDMATTKHETSHEVTRFVNDWPREVVDAQHGAALVAYLARRPATHIASLLRTYAPPSAGPITQGLWAYHADKIKSAWEDDDVVLVCRILVALCMGARRWGLVDAAAIAVARGRLPLFGGRDEWADTLDRMDRVAPAEHVWAPWCGKVGPLPHATAMARAARDWPRSDERSIVLGALRLFDGMFRATLDKTVDPLLSTMCGDPPAVAVPI